MKRLLVIQMLMYLAAMNSFCQEEQKLFVNFYIKQTAVKDQSEETVFLKGEIIPLHAELSWLFSAPLQPFSDNDKDELKRISIRLSGIKDGKEDHDNIRVVNTVSSMEGKQGAIISYVCRMDGGSNAIAPYLFYIDTSRLDIGKYKLSFSFDNHGIKTSKDINYSEYTIEITNPLDALDQLEIIHRNYKARLQDRRNMPALYNEGMEYLTNGTMPINSFLDRNYPGTLSGLAKSMGDMKQHFMWRVFELCRDDDTSFRRRCIRRNARIDLDDLLMNRRYMEEHKSEIISDTSQIKTKFFSDVSWKRDPGAAIDGYLSFTDKQLTLHRVELTKIHGPNDNNLKDYIVYAMIFHCMQRAQDIYWVKIVNNPQYMKYAEENLDMLREETGKKIKMMYELFEIDRPLLISPDAITLEGIAQARIYPTGGQNEE